MEVSLLLPFTPKHLERARVVGVRAVQLRIGPGFPITTDPGAPFDEALAARDAFGQAGIRVASLGFYRNHLHPDPRQREDDAARLVQVLRLAREVFAVETVAVFAGRDPEKGIEDSIPEFAAVWAPLARHAEDAGVRLAFENCTMFRSYPAKGINLCHTPRAYERMFEAVPSPALGMEFDPSHCHKQRIDPLRMLRQFAGRIFHVHAKDHERDAELEYQYGCFDPRVSRDRIPPLGEVDFAPLIAELGRQGYRGDVAIEGETDPAAPTEDAFRALLREAVASLRHQIATL